MNKRAWIASTLSLWAAGLYACQSDDTAYPANYDAGGGGDGSVEASGPDTGGGGGGGGGGVGGGGGLDSGPDSVAPATQWVLLSYNGQSSSELAAFNTGTGVVDGRIDYPGFIGTTSTESPDPYLLEQSVDVVAKLDRAEPWVQLSSWNVALNDAPDGSSYSDPNAVVVTTGTKAYVLRYTRNEIAIIDFSQTADAGAPTGSIDLSGLVQANDTDGLIEMTAGVYVAAQQRVYVVLGNIDTNDVINNGANLLCAGTVSTVIAIDTASDSLVSLGDGGPGGALALQGTNPIPGGLVYDSASNRLLIAQAGCNQPSDGGAGPLVEREVEALSLATGTSTKLLDATQNGFPSAFLYLDATHAVLQFDFTGAETYAWNPTQSVLGPLVANAPDTFDQDGKGNLVGVAQTVLADGGTGPLAVISVPIAGGTATTLGTNPFTLAPPAFVSGAAIWPPTH